MTYSLGTEKHVFVDWDLIEPGYGVAARGERPEPWEMPHGLRLSVHSPRIDTQPIIEPDMPWEESIDFLHVVFEDDGRWRLYYLCWDRSAEDIWQNPRASMLAYAESTDGVNWVKPSVGTVRFDGSTDNNLVYALNVAMDRPVLSPSVFKDPSASPSERYKLAYRGSQDGNPLMYGAVSPDGLQWTTLEKPILSEYMPDTQNVLTFDSEKGRYVGYFRGWTEYEVGKSHGRRLISYAETARFDNWPHPKPIVAPDVHDNPDTDIYTNSYTPWPGADAHLMFPALYQRSLDVAEVHMMTSRDGVHWERPAREPIIPKGEPGSDWEGSMYAGAGLITTDQGEWSLTVGPQPLSHNQYDYPEGMALAPHLGYLCRATWRQDGFMSLEADSLGSFSTVPLTFTGSHLVVNAWTRFGGEIRVELVDASDAGHRTKTAKAAKGYSFEDCVPVSGNHLGYTVAWKGGSDLSAWSGRPVRLRFQMRRARIYALQFDH